MRSGRLGFSHWNAGDSVLAASLWGDPQVSQYITAGGAFTQEQVTERLVLEIQNQAQRGVQYWPLFLLREDRFVGCCGLRPFGDCPAEYELGFHLLPAHWGQGFASEAAGTVLRYASSSLQARTIYAGHHPDNIASQKLLQKLGFDSIGKKYYQPTGLYHFAYRYVPRKNM